jgi:hypothetical protein
MSINSQRAAAHVREWNKAFPVGQAVEYRGEPHKTWSPAGLSRGKPSVFLEKVEEPVPLRVLAVPGWETHR